MANERLKRFSGNLLSLAFTTGAGLMAIKEAWAAVFVLGLAGLEILAAAHWPFVKGLIVKSTASKSPILPGSISYLENGADGSLTPHLTDRQKQILVLVRNIAICLGILLFLAGLFVLYSITFKAVPQTSPALSSNIIVDDLIQWDFTEDFAMTRADDITRIFVLKADGTNISNHFLTGLKVYAISDASNKRFDGYFRFSLANNNMSVGAGEVISANKIENIRPGVKFRVEVPFGVSGVGLPADRFLSDVGGLTFVFEYNGKTFKRHIAADEIVQQVAQFDSAARSAIKPPAFTPIPPAPLAVNRVANFQFAARQITSSNNNLPFALQITILTDQVIEKPAFLITCDGTIQEGHAGSGSGAYTNVQNMITDDKRSFGFRWSFPDFTPEQPITVTLLAATPISCSKLKDARLYEFRIRP